jgi:hypothetical protein
MRKPLLAPMDGGSRCGGHRPANKIAVRVAEPAAVDLTDAGGRPAGEPDAATASGNGAAAAA